MAPVLIRIDDDIRDLTKRAKRVLSSDLTLGFVVGSVTTLTVAAAYTRYYKRIPNADSMPRAVMDKQRWIKGVVASVGDADNFRLYHTPGLFWRWPLKFRTVPTAAKDLKDQTIHIRIAGVDAPEAAHFGKPSQPYSAEALAWLKNEIEGKQVWVQVYRRDQYQRIVGMTAHTSIIPFRPLTLSRCIPIRMLRAGYGEVYESAGAEYGKWGKEPFVEAQAEAVQHRRGMWASNSVLESVSEYKKRTKTGDVSSTSNPSTSSAKSPSSEKSDAPPKRKPKQSKGLLGRLAFWR